MFTFHLDSSGLPRLLGVLDDVAAQLAGHPDFRGFVCLDHDSLRHQIIVISLWDGDGLEETNEVFVRATQQIAGCVELGMNSREYEILRLVPGTALSEDLFGQVLTS